MCVRVGFFWGGGGWGGGVLVPVIHIFYSQCAFWNLGGRITSFLLHRGRMWRSSKNQKSNKLKLLLPQGRASLIWQLITRSQSRLPPKVTQKLPAPVLSGPCLFAALLFRSLQIVRPGLQCWRKSERERILKRQE